MIPHTEENRRGAGANLVQLAVLSTPPLEAGFTVETRPYVKADYGEELLLIVGVAPG